MLFRPPVEKLKLIQDYFYNKKQTLCLAESCTGGLVSYWLTHLPGSSVYFKGGLVSYDTNVKINLLGLDAGFTKREGVVNKRSVECMAQGVKKLFNTDWAVSVSGIAGPSAGDLSESVGKVAFSVTGSVFKSCVKQMETGDRENIRHQSAIFALDFLISELK